MNLESIKSSWFANPRADLLAGVTVALALIPEVISFSIVAGLNPMMGLYASFCITVLIAFAGGRPAMVSAAAGSMALVIVRLVADHGPEYMLAATLMAGALQLVGGFLRVDRFVSFIPQPVIAGFVNGLAILIFLAQMPHILGSSWATYAMVAGTLAIVYGMPVLTKAIPSPLVAIVVMTAVSMLTKADVRMVGDMGEITRALPPFHMPALPLQFATLQILFPYAATLALVGLLESLLTATIVDELTGTRSDKNREVKGQGFANIVAGLFGGMPGCAMIGQSVINVKSGGRGRLSTLAAGGFLLFLILALGDVVTQIPMPALAGVMVMVSIGTFDWQSVRNLRRLPVSDALAMAVTVATVVVTHDLAKGVLAGVVLSAVAFGWKAAALRVDMLTPVGGSKVYRVSGQLFFASATAFGELFDSQGDPDRATVDLTGTHVWDQSGVVAMERLAEKYQALGKRLQFVGLNHESQRLVERIGRIETPKV